MLEAKNLGLQVKNKWLVKDVSFRFEAGKHYAICGPEGAGKSTLLKLLGLELPSSEGSVYYDHLKSNFKHLHSLTRSRALLSQQLDIGFPLNVEEIVLMGRYPHAQSCSSAQNEKICSEVMDWVDVTQFVGKDYNTLSSGDKQRVQFARVLAQVWEPPAGKTRYLMLDEPITYMDPWHQLQVLQKVKELVDQRTVVISVLHDLNLVMKYADNVLMMHRGGLYETGTPEMVLKTKTINKVFEAGNEMAEVDGGNFLIVN